MGELGGPWLWEWLESPLAHEVPFWLRIGPGPDGAAHGIVVGLVRLREAEDAPDDAFRALADIADDAMDQWGVDRSEVAELLDSLEAQGVVEARAGSTAGPAWRATPLAVEAIQESYARRHPLDWLRPEPEPEPEPKRRRWWRRRR